MVTVIVGSGSCEGTVQCNGRTTVMVGSGFCGYNKARSGKGAAASDRAVIARSGKGAAASDRAVIAETTWQRSP